MVKKRQIRGIKMKSYRVKANKYIPEFSQLAFFAEGLVGCFVFRKIWGFFWFLTLSLEKRTFK